MTRGPQACTVDTVGPRTHEWGSCQVSGFAPDSAFLQVWDSGKGVPSPHSSLTVKTKGQEWKRSSTSSSSYGTNRFCAQTASIRNHNHNNKCSYSNILSILYVFTHLTLTSITRLAIIIASVAQVKKLKRKCPASCHKADTPQSRIQSLYP